MKNEIIVGLDIGTTKIACFVGQKQDNGKVKILGHGRCESQGVERGVVQNILAAADSIRRAVDQASVMAQMGITEVYVGVAGQHIKSLSSKGSIMIPKEREYILQEDVDTLTRQQYGRLLNPGEEIVHVFPQVYAVDGEELTNCDPVGVTGKQLECTFHIVTGNTANLKRISLSVAKAGLQIKRMVLEPIASSMACLDDTDLEAGVALVDIGGGTTDIAIFKDGIIRHTSVLPLAGNAITNDIKIGCGVMRNQAEALKTRFGSCMPQQVSEDDYVSIPVFRHNDEREIGLRTLATIIKNRVEVLLGTVDYEIQQSGYAKQLIGGLVLTGGGAYLKHIKDFAAYTTGIDTRIGLPDEHLDQSTQKELIHPMYSTGIGLVLFGIHESEREQLGIDDEEIEEGNDSHVADFPFTPQEPEESKPTDTTATGNLQQPETPKKPRRSLRDRVNSVIDIYLKGITRGAAIDDEDEDND